METEDHASPAPAARQRVRRQVVALGGIAALLFGVLAWVVISASRGDATLDQALERSDHVRESTVADVPAPGEAPAPLRVEEVAKGGAAESSSERTAAEHHLLVHVVDARTGDPVRRCRAWSHALPDVIETYPARSIADPSTIHGFSTRAKGSSPLGVDAPEKGGTLETLLICAPGYTSAGVQIDWSDLEPRTVKLAPVARLTVLVTGIPPGVEASVLLHDLTSLERELPSLIGARSEGTALAAPCARQLEFVRGSFSDGRLTAARINFLDCEEPDFRESLDAESCASFADVPDGRWLVEAAVEIDHLPDVASPPNWAHHAVAEITLQSGEEATLEVAWHEVVPASRVRVVGRIVFDRGWLEPGLRELPTYFEVVSLEPDSQAPSGHAGPERTVQLTPGERQEILAFDAGTLPLGRFVARLDSWQWQTVVATPAADGDEVVIEVPPPTRVRVRAFEPGAPAVAVPCDLEWEAFGSELLMFHPSPKSGNVPSPFRPPSTPPTESDVASDIELLVPQGQLALRVGRPYEHWARHTRHRVVGAASDIGIELTPFSMLDVTLRNGSSVVGATLVRIVSGGICVEQDGQPLTISGWQMSPGSTFCTVVVDGAGRALLTGALANGWEIVAPVEVELRRGETVAVDLPVRRAQ